MKEISLCKGHEGGFGLIKVIAPKATYEGVPVTKLTVKIVERGPECVQCKANGAKK